MVRLVRSRAPVPVPVLVLVLSMSLTGCAPLVDLDKPSPDGPRISNLRLTPDESSVGCPVELSFSVDTTQDALDKAIAAWTWARGREGTHGYLALAADQQALGSQPGDRFVAPPFQRIEGKLFRPMALTISLAVIGSLLLTLTLIPVLSTLLFRRPPSQRESPLSRT